LQTLPVIKVIEKPCGSLLVWRAIRITTLNSPRVITVVGLENWPIVNGQIFLFLSPIYYKQSAPGNSIVPGIIALSGHLEMSVGFM
jgi:hypothetical protein